MTIEENFKQLDEILNKMENQETSLEESFSCYEKGMKILKDCHASLDEVEKKIQILNEKTDDKNEGIPF